MLASQGSRRGSPFRVGPVDTLFWIRRTGVPYHVPARIRFALVLPPDARVLSLTSGSLRANSRLALQQGGAIPPARMSLALAEHACMSSHRVKA